MLSVIRYTLVLMLFMSQYVFAQLNEDFADGDFTNNPSWTSSNQSGTGSDFLVTAGELQSDGPAASSTIWISTLNTQGFTSGETVWQFKARYANAPSSSNRIFVYLTSDKSDLTDNPVGYYIRLGESGSDDGIDLFKTSSSTAIISDPNPSVATGIDVHVKMTRATDGTWTLEADPAGGNSFSTIGTVVDNEITSGSNFGFLVDHTSTRNQDYFFDDITISSTDTTPPVLNNVEVVTDIEIDVLFSEDVETTTAESLNNYLVDNGIGNPTSANLDASERNRVHLIFANTFTNGTTYELTVENVEDLDNNVMTPATINFLYFVEVPADFKDLIINEIMADPTPPNDLPEVEFVEIFNNSSKIFDLENWSFSDLSTTGTLSSLLFSPGEYLILCPSANISDFQNFGNVIGLTNWPSLNNSGDLLYLRDDSNNIIDSVNYKLSWYDDAAKDDGGFTLELINPSNFCGEEENWSASLATSGGTPGSVNSIFDDQFDTVPPVIISGSAININEIEINFNERLDLATIDVADFSVDLGITIDHFGISNDFKTITLNLVNELDEDIIYTVSVSNIADCSNNNITNAESVEVILVSNVQLDFKAVVFNEILPDPTPPNDLPETEFVELFNNSNKIIDLKGWTFSDASSSTTIPQKILFENEHLILCPIASVSLMEPFGNVIGLDPWPSLNNSGDILILKDQNGMTIDSINYLDDWYNSSTKSEGGWTLELIDPNNKCGEKLNWTASENSIGGTPGMINSVFSQNPDLTGPELEEALGLKVDSIILKFNERLDEESIQSANYTLTPTSPIKEIISSDLRNIVLVPVTPLQVKTLYEIEVNNIKDCSGNLIQDMNSAQFAVIKSADSSDIIINELLFDPRSGGVDFVELYNRSDKYISLKNWQITNADRLDDSLVIDNSRTITFADEIMSPSSYKVLNTNKTILMEQYPLAHSENFLEMASLPSYPNDEGIVTLMNSNLELMDVFDYFEDYHSPLLNDTEGVSLERVSYSSETNDPNNWKSAVASVGFATPGYLNSQSRENITVTEGEIIIEPKIIIPDGSGQQEFATISYKFSTTGLIGNVTIYDLQGRIVKKLGNNDFLGAEGFYTWDASHDDGSKVRMGYYLVFFEVLDSNGEVKKFKEKIVVGTKF